MAAVNKPKLAALSGIKLKLIRFKLRKLVSEKKFTSFQEETVDSISNFRIFRPGFTTLQFSFCTDSLLLPTVVHVERDTPIMLSVHIGPEGDTQDKIARVISRKIEQWIQRLSFESDCLIHISNSLHVSSKYGSIGSVKIVNNENDASNATFILEYGTIFVPIHVVQTEEERISYVQRLVEPVPVWVFQKWMSSHCIIESLAGICKQYNKKSSLP